VELKRKKLLEKVSSKKVAINILYMPQKKEFLFCRLTKAGATA